MPITGVFLPLALHLSRHHRLIQNHLLDVEIVGRLVGSNGLGDGDVLVSEIVGFEVGNDEIGIGVGNVDGKVVGRCVVAAIVPFPHNIVK